MKQRRRSVTSGLISINKHLSRPANGPRWPHVNQAKRVFRLHSRNRERNSRAFVRRIIRREESRSFWHLRSESGDLEITRVGRRKCLEASHFLYAYWITSETRYCMNLFFSPCTTHRNKFVSSCASRYVFDIGTGRHNVFLFRLVNRQYKFIINCHKVYLRWKCWTHADWVTPTFATNNNLQDNKKKNGILCVFYSPCCRTRTMACNEKNRFILMYRRKQEINSHSISPLWRSAIQ